MAERSLHDWVGESIEGWTADGKGYVGYPEPYPFIKGGITKFEIKMNKERNERGQKLDVSRWLKTVDNNGNGSVPSSMDSQEGQEGQKRPDNLIDNPDVFKNEAGTRTHTKGKSSIPGEPLYKPTQSTIDRMKQQAPAVIKATRSSAAEKLATDAISQEADTRPAYIVPDTAVSTPTPRTDMAAPVVDPGIVTVPQVEAQPKKLSSKPRHIGEVILGGLAGLFGVGILGGGVATAVGREADRQDVIDAPEGSLFDSDTKISSVTNVNINRFGREKKSAIADSLSTQQPEVEETQTPTDTPEPIATTEPTNTPLVPTPSEMVPLTPTTESIGVAYVDLPSSRLKELNVTDGVAFTFQGVHFEIGVDLGIVSTNGFNAEEFAQSLVDVLTHYRLMRNGTLSDANSGNVYRVIFRDEESNPNIPTFREYPDFGIKDGVINEFGNETEQTILYSDKTFEYTGLHPEPDSNRDKLDMLMTYDALRSFSQMYGIDIDIPEIDRLLSDTIYSLSTSTN